MLDVCCFITIWSNNQGGGGVTFTQVYYPPTIKMDPKWCIAPCYICTPIKMMYSNCYGAE